MTTPTRRHFLAAAAAAPLAAAQQQSPIPTRPLGKTGIQVSILGLGGHHQARPADERESFRLVHTAVDNGITFMDNAWDYHDGRAEEVMGKALAMDGYRKKVFLMTKVCDRDQAGAMKHLEDSLRRLKTDVIDLWQFHECNYYNDPELILEKGGLRAALEAKKKAKCASLASPATSTRASIAKCWPSISPGTPARCRTTSWTIALKASVTK